MFCFGWKKIGSCSHLPVKLPFKAWDLVTILKKLSYFTYWFCFERKDFLSYIYFETIRACRLVTLIVRNNIIFVWNILVLLHVYVKTHSILKNIYYTFVMTHDFPVLPRVSGYIFVNSTFVLLLSWLFYWVFTPSHC